MSEPEKSQSTPQEVQETHSHSDLYPVNPRKVQIDTVEYPSGMFRPGYFSHPAVGYLFAAPKTGFSTLMAYLPLLGNTPAAGTLLTVGLRDPVSRWVSGFNHLVLHGGQHHMNTADFYRAYFGQEWYNRAFPPQRVWQEDPVSFARSWILGPGADLCAFGGDLHYAPVSLGIQQRFPEWPDIRYIPYQQWFDVLSRCTPRRLIISNRGHYAVDPGIFEPLRPLILEQFSEDTRLCERAGIAVTEAKY
jgi:hypothetical protein